jgi:hypothetical protein
MVVKRNGTSLPFALWTSKTTYNGGRNYDLRLTIAYKRFDQTDVLKSSALDIIGGFKNKLAWNVLRSETFYLRPENACLAQNFKQHSDTSLMVLRLYRNSSGFYVFIDCLIYFFPVAASTQNDAASARWCCCISEPDPSKPSI